MGEKTEKATPKKLRDARKKGQVAKSQDLPGAFTFAASISFTLWMASFFFEKLGQFLVAALKGVSEPDLDRVVSGFFMEGLSLMLVTSLPVLIIVSLVGVLSTFLSVGPVWAPEVFKFDIKKFNPVDNLKAKFKMKTLVELIKQLLKIIVAGYIVYLTVKDSLPVLVQTVKMPILPCMAIYAKFLLDVVFRVGLFFLAIAICDLAYQKYTFSKEMMMEKFEIKQEYKNMEGDPQIKSRRKQIAHETVYSDGPASAMRQAKAVVTNPTHLAIALSYNKEEDAAPFICALGEGILAERIIELAKKMEIPILRNIPLAHELYDNGELYNYIPEQTYEAVAEIIRWLNSLEENPSQADYSEDLK
ncbi:MAG: sctU [Chlamydiales bacterium]|jgi:type III secretion YscU/HrpY family protein|nr:sctU [Chlamydiales bacterium]